MFVQHVEILIVCVFFFLIYRLGYLSDGKKKYLNNTSHYNSVEYLKTKSVRIARVRIQTISE